jgi:hypothetical protein
MVEPIDLNKYRAGKASRKSQSGGEVVNIETWKRDREQKVKEVSEKELGSDQVPMITKEEVRNGKLVQVREPDFDAYMAKRREEAMRPPTYEDGVREQEAKVMAREIVDTFCSQVRSSGRAIDGKFNESVLMDYVMYKGMTYGDPARERYVRHRQIDDIFKKGLEPQKLFVTAIQVLGEEGLERAKKLLPGLELDLNDDMNAWQARYRMKKAGGEEDGSRGRILEHRLKGGTHSSRGGPYSDRRDSTEVRKYGREWRDVMLKPEDITKVPEQELRTIIDQIEGGLLDHYDVAVYLGTERPRETVELYRAIDALRNAFIWVAQKYGVQKILDLGGVRVTFTATELGWLNKHNRAELSVPKDSTAEEIRRVLDERLSRR